MPLSDHHDRDASVSPGDVKPGDERQRFGRGDRVVGEHGGEGTVVEPTNVAGNVGVYWDSHSRRLNVVEWPQARLLRLAAVPSVPRAPDVKVWCEDCEGSGTMTIAVPDPRDPSVPMPEPAPCDGCLGKGYRELAARSSTGTPDGPADELDRLARDWLSPGSSTGTPERCTCEKAAEGHLGWDRSMVDPDCPLHGHEAVERGPDPKLQAVVDAVAGSSTGTEDARERVAEAIYEVVRSKQPKWPPWHERDEHQRQSWYRSADAALAAARPSGTEEERDV